MGITYEQLSGDLTEVNYSSIRAGLIEFRRRCAMLQHHIMVFQFCRPVWNRWLDMAVLNGSISIPDYSSRQSSYRRVKWIAHGWPYMHPVQDMQAQKMAVRSGFKSRSEVVSEQGYDSEQIDAEISADNRRADGLDLKYDSDSRASEKEPLISTNPKDDNDES